MNISFQFSYNYSELIHFNLLSFSLSSLKSTQIKKHDCWSLKKLNIRFTPISQNSLPYLHQILQESSFQQPQHFTNNYLQNQNLSWLNHGREVEASSHYLNKKTGIDKCHQWASNIFFLIKTETSLKGQDYQLTQRTDHLLTLGTKDNSDFAKVLHRFTTMNDDHQINCQI